MINHHVLLAVSAERRADLIGEARDARRARSATAPPRPARQRGTRMRLADGSAIVVRPVRADDTALIADGFERLSPQSRYARFLSPKAALTDREIRRLTDVDHRDHEALVAVDARDGRGVGVARFVRNNRDPRAAELAITVVDEWHHRGVGTDLVTRLAARARQEGIDRFTALVAVDNYAVLSLLRKVALDLQVVDHDGETAELSIALSGFAPAAPGGDGWIGTRLVRRLSFRRAFAG